MTRLPRVTGSHVVRSLRKVGVGLLSKIQKDTGIDREAFVSLIGN